MRLPEGQERDEQELFLQAGLIGPFVATKGYTSAKLEGAAKRAVALGQRLGRDSPAQSQALFAGGYLATVHMMRGELRTALGLAEEILALAERLGDPHILALASFRMGNIHSFLGELAAARPHLEEGLALYDPERDRAKAARFGQDARMACHSQLGFVLWQQGFPDEALWHAEEGIAAARAASHPLSEVFALALAACVHQSRGELALCLERAEAALAIATEQMLPFWAAFAMTLSGWALVKNGQAEKGLDRLRAGLHAGTGHKTKEPDWRALLAAACLDTSRIEEGLSAVREGLAQTGETEARGSEAELNRLEGELFLASKEPDEKRAEVSFCKAIAVARGQGAKSFELRAAASLARLLARRGRRAEARDLLAPVYGWFTEGFDTADLKEAKALLDQLA